MPQPSALRESIEKLERLIAGSPTFQAQVNAAVELLPETAAERRIHKVCIGTPGKRPEDAPRPFAVIEIGERNKTRQSGGDRNTFDGDGWLILSFHADLANPDEPGESLIDFATWAYDVLDEMCELAGYDDNLNIAECVQEQEPTFAGEFSGHEIPWCWVSWRIQWTRF